MEIMKFLRNLEILTRPVCEETKSALAKRWNELPEGVRTSSQSLGRHGVGCEGTHGVFPKCNFACSPCYHSRDSNQVRVDGIHTLGEVENQMSFLEKSRGPRAHAQLIGGEVSLLSPQDHANAIEVMRSHGREPMSFSHGDFDYDYLKEMALDEKGRARFSRLSFAGHFDTTMRGRRGIRQPESEEELNPYRKTFCESFQRLKKEHGVRFFLAHNMTVTPKNIAGIAGLIEDCHEMGFNMFSFQPAAFVGNDKRWKENYRELSADDVWAQIEAGAGTKLPYKVIQVGDERCNRTAWGFYLGNKWFSVLDGEDPKDIEARDAFYKYLGGVHFNAPLPLLVARLFRAAVAYPGLVLLAISWAMRTVRRVGGMREIVRGKIIPMTFVMHSFMDADQVKPAWELLQRGEISKDPKILEVQERLKACSYAMAHPEIDTVIPACVQHAVFDSQENFYLKQLLPIPKVRGEKRQGVSEALEVVRSV